jgi:hypothetical protein
MKKNHKRPPQTLKSIRPRPIGRPNKSEDIDPKKVYELALYHAPAEEIAKHFRVDVETLKKYHQDELDVGYTDGNLAVRKQQYKAAISGSPMMLLHLGKHYLKQRDTHGELAEKHRAEVAEIVDMLKTEYNEIKK